MHHTHAARVRVANPRGWFLRGSVLANKKEYKDAFADLEKVIIMDMEYPETVRLWADVLAWPVAKKKEDN